VGADPGQRLADPVRRDDGDPGRPTERLRQHALAAADQSADGDDRWSVGPSPREGAGKREERPRLLGLPDRLVRGRRRVGGQEGGDLPAHPGSVSGIEVDHPVEVVVVGR
jgi:hypothetical protein